MIIMKTTMKAIDNVDIMKYWNANNNAGIKPDELTSGSGRTVFFKDEFGHEWTSRICDKSGMSILHWQASIKRI